MTNKLAEQIGIDAKKLSHLLKGCGMTQDVCDVDILKAVHELRENNQAESYRHGWCLHVASLHKVSAEDICKAIASEGIDSKSSEYIPLFSATCQKVAAGMDPVAAVVEELESYAAEIEDTTSTAGFSLNELDSTIDELSEAIVYDALSLMKERKQEARQYVDDRLRRGMQRCMKSPEVKAAAKLLIEGDPEGKPLLEMHVEG
ncbi:hypothetical protein ACSYAD_31425 [Acaryochloris marina NIES-2412]|uniref:hypothetical protein n=1 Tax=Acaryochloris marina TaxID=155978 RepID=UPI00405820FD